MVGLGRGIGAPRFTPNMQACPPILDQQLCSLLSALLSSFVSPQDADLVILEFSANDKRDAPFTDPERKGYEQLVRKLLQLKRRRGWLAGWLVDVLRLDAVGAVAL